MYETHKNGFLLLTVIFTQAYGSQPSKPSYSCLNQITHIQGIKDIIIGYLDHWDMHKKIDDNKWVCNLAYSPNGRYLAHTADIDTVKIYDTATDNYIHILEHAAKKLRYSPDGLSLAIHNIGLRFDTSTGVIEPQIIFIDTTNFQKLRGWTENKYLSDFALSHDNKFLITAQKRDICIWENCKAGKKIKSIGECDKISILAISKDDKLIATATYGNDDHHIRIWDVSSKKLIYVIAKLIHTIACMEQCRALVFAPNNNNLAFTDGKLVKIYDTQTGVLLHTLTQDAPAKTIEYSPNGLLLAVVDAHNHVKLWDTQMGVILYQLDKTVEIADVCFSPDGLHLACGAVDQVKILKNQALELAKELS